MPAVQRREQLLKALAPSTTEAAIETQQNIDSSAEVKADTQAPVSRSQEIAQEILSAGPLTRSSLLRRDGSSSTGATAMKLNVLRSASGAGGGGPENPIYVTIAERK